MIAFYTLRTNTFRMDKCNIPWNKQHLALLAFVPPLSLLIAVFLRIPSTYFRNICARVLAHAHKFNNLGFFRMILEKKKANTE